VVRAVLAVTAMVAIFGASVSAARETEPTVVVAQAALQAPISVAPAAALVPAPTAVQAGRVKAALTKTQAVVVPEAVAERAPVQVAEDAPAAPSDEVLDLIFELEERDRQIAALEEQLAFLRQAQLAAQATPANETTSFAVGSNGRISDAANEDAMEQWRAGYILGGGQNLPAFENTILPCESGTQPNPDTAVGRTDDWGRAQINRPTWKDRFESLTGADFETHIVDPTLNGYMAAHVELEQGLRAWTCWRKR